MCTLVHTNNDPNYPYGENYYVGCSCGTWDDWTNVVCDTTFLSNYYGQTSAFKNYVDHNDSYVYVRFRFVFL
jgi:hypothetical protein